MRTWPEFKDLIAKRYFTRLLVETDCNIAEAARIGKVNRPDFYKKLKKYDIDHRQIAKDILEYGKPEVINKLRRKLNRKLVKPNWDAPLPDYTPYQPKARNSNVRT